MPQNTCAQTSEEKYDAYLKTLQTFKPDSVKQLDLRGMGLTQWPDALLKYERVTVIYLEGNFFSDIPDELKHYKQLQKLIMDRNTMRLSRLNLRGLHALTTFSASHNPFHPHLSLLGKRKLEKIILTNANLISLRVNAPGLQEIDLSHNAMEMLIKPFWRRGRLETVVLLSNKLTKLPAGIGSHKGLQKLVLSNNNFRAIPAQMQHFPKLESLMFYNNQLDSLPEFLWTMTSLREIDVHHNHITYLPAGIGMLTEVEELYLAHNRFGSMPDEIGNLLNLKYLYIENNQLEQLPASMAQLAKLQRLSLMGNKFIVFPHVLTQLISLEELDISKNDIEAFPTSWQLQRNLKMLLFHDNACEEGMQCIRYLKAMDEVKTAQDVKFQY